MIEGWKETCLTKLAAWMKGWNHVLAGGWGETYCWGWGTREENLGSCDGETWYEEVEEADEADEHAEKTDSPSELELPEDVEDWKGDGA
jgi:hypothetical protein